jgi:DNA repair protein RadC
MTKSNNKINNEPPTPYKTTARAAPDLNATLARALQAVLTELKSKELYPTLDAFTAPELVKNYLVISLALEEREHFHVLFLDNQHKLLLDARMFSGTIDGASVYPREVVKRALQCNANAVIFAHNHPSGICTPSHADRQITDKLKQGLATIDIRVLDHVIVGHMDTYSFAEHGEI